MVLDDMIGEAIDRLVNVEMRFSSGMPRGMIHRLYDAARTKQQRPLSTLAGEALMNRLSAGDRVLIVTGAGAPPWLPFGETDGPIGAAALARTLDLGLGVKPILVAEERNLGPIAASAHAGGIPVLSASDFAQRGGCTMLEPLRLGETDGPASAREILNRHQPRALIFVEKGSPNKMGVFHTITGTGRSRAVMASADVLADEARAAGILTIGIGDGGNEIGFGLIDEDVARIQTYGTRCQCPCGGGIAAVAATDVLVVAAISNWGAYGIAAALAIALKNRAVLHDETTEQRMLEACVAAGAVDGVLARPLLSVDGTSAASQRAIVVLLGNLVDNALSSLNRPY